MGAIRLERLLVPVDFSRDSEAALEYALFLASRLDASIVIVHARGQPARLSEQEAIWSLNPEEALGRMLTRLRERGFTRTEARLVVGAVANAIVDVAITGRIDLIVMGTHGRRGLRHVALGSVAEHVIREAPCPVLTVREGSEEPGPG